MTEWSIVNINNSSSICGCCGKQNLRMVIVLRNIKTLERISVATDCAGQILYGRKCASNTSRARKHAHAIRRAKRWIASGIPISSVLTNVAVECGYSCYFRNGVIEIGDFATITVGAS